MRIAEEFIRAVDEDGPWPLYWPTAKERPRAEQAQPAAHSRFAQHVNKHARAGSSALRQSTRPGPCQIWLFRETRV